MFDTRGTRPIDEGLLTRMNQALFHRGPDEGGVHIEPGVGLAHRRLSIIDLSSGHQPLYNEDHSVVIVFNGEIYNFQSLHQELAALGHTFRTHSDTEVIVHAWEQWGEACVERLRGMFAFALWDRRRQIFFLARDRLGIKPLYYALLADGLLLFGSELKALLVHPSLDRAVDPLAVEDYFAYGYVPEPRTILHAARKLPAGHVLTLGPGQSMAPLSPTPRQYWDIRFTGTHPGSEADICAQLLDKLKDAVSSHLVSEVPLGAFLSGGVDSSAVVAMMAGLTNGPVNTCSIAFGDPAFDESQWAAQVAQQYHTQHHVEQVDANDYDLIDTLAALYDEPYADSSAIPTYRVCQLARQRVTVALSGDGGDENFAGYRRYRWHHYESGLRAKLPQGMRGPLFGLLGRVYPKADWAPRVLRAKSTFEALARDDIAGYFHGMSVLHDGLRAQLYSPAFHRQLQGYQAIEVLRHHALNAPDHPLSRVQYLDMKTYLVDDILTKVDRASMAHALEVRVPLLDHEFVEWVASLPPDMKLRGQEGKFIFKKALESKLSTDILYRRKQGFAVPLAAWFRGPLRARVREALLGPAMADTGLFDMNFIQRLVDQHQSGRRDHSAPLWSLLMFEAFQRRVAAGASLSQAA